VKRKTKKRKGHPGFSFKCRKIMSFKEWEKRVKAVKRSRSGINPYAVVNASCKVHRRRRRAR